MVHLNPEWPGSKKKMSIKYDLDKMRPVKK